MKIQKIQTSEPKIWEGKRSQKTLNMSTPGHIRAAMLKQMYETISSPMHQNDERLDALLSLKNIIKVCVLACCAYFISHPTSQTPY